MSQYVENQLGKGEIIINDAKISKISIIPSIISLIFIVTIFKALKNIIGVFFIHLAITNKRVIGKYGIINTNACDAPLNKVQNVSVSSGLGGKIFGYGTVEIHTAAGKYKFNFIKKAEAFRSQLSAQIDQYEEDQAKRQAEEMAKAMAGMMNK